MKTASSRSPAGYATTARDELEKALVSRGRIWSNCEPGKPDAKGRVAVTTDLPSPNGISDKMVVYAFEEVDPQKGGDYLGEFRVAGVADKKIALEPTMTMTAREQKRLERSKGPWSLYELLPLDQHELFVDMPDDVKAALPADGVAEYTHDGQKAEPDDPSECKVEGIYVRRLRDYAALFKMYHGERTLFVDLYESIARDLQYAMGARPTPWSNWPSSSGARPLWTGTWRGPRRNVTT